MTPVAPAVFRIPTTGSPARLGCLGPLAGGLVLPGPFPGTGKPDKEAVLVGDTVWDTQVCRKAAVVCIGVLSGGVPDGTPGTPTERGLQVCGLPHC